MLCTIDISLTKEQNNVNDESNKKLSLKSVSLILGLCLDHRKSLFTRAIQKHSQCRIQNETFDEKIFDIVKIVADYNYYLYVGLHITL